MRPLGMTSHHWPRRLFIYTFKRARRISVNIAKLPQLLRLGAKRACWRSRHGP